MARGSNGNILPGDTGLISRFLGSSLLRNLVLFCWIQCDNHIFLEGSHRKCANEYPIKKVAYAIRDFMGGNETNDAGLDMREVFLTLCRLRCSTFAITQDDMRVVGVNRQPENLNSQPSI